MAHKINIYIDNNTGIVNNPDWDQIYGDVEFKFVWKNENKIVNAKKIIFPKDFSKGNFEYDDYSITKIKFINNIDLDIEINGGYFLIFLKSLEEIDLSGLSRLKKINGGFFLSYCSKLNHLDLNPLKNIEQINNYFLSDCKGFKNIDLSPLEKLKEIPNDFLSRCNDLEEIDLLPLKNATKIGESFFACCHNLKNVKNISFFKVKAIDIQFMRFCKNLKNIDLSSFTSLEKVGKLFLSNCSKHLTVILPRSNDEIIFNKETKKQLKNLLKKNKIFNKKNKEISNDILIINNKTMVSI
jgi:hypothetical protein